MESRILSERLSMPLGKRRLISMASEAKCALDLGAGNGFIAHELSSRYKAKVVAIEKDGEYEYGSSPLVKWVKSDIVDYLSDERNQMHQFDLIVFSAVLHELSDAELNLILRLLPKFMAKNCRILIREPFFDKALGPVLPCDEQTVCKLIANSNPSDDKLWQYRTCSKKSTRGFSPCARDFLSYAFVLSYGEESWERERREFRYARSLEWCERAFNFATNPYVSFRIEFEFDESYRKHFAAAGIDASVLDRVQYTGMIVEFKYGMKIKK